MVVIKLKIADNNLIAKNPQLSIHLIALITQFHIPSAPLNEFVSHLFYYSDHHPVHNIERFLPDGNSEIIIDLTGTAKPIYENQSLKVIQSVRNGWVSGVRNGPITIPSGKEDRMLIIFFKKGRTFPFFDFPLDEIKDQVIEAELIFGSSFTMLRQQLLEARVIDHMFTLVEDFLYERASHKINQEVTQLCINHAVDQLSRRSNIQSLTSLVNKVGFSQKHFIALFKKQVGLTPKRFMRILRFQHTIMEIEHSYELNWNSIAHHCGYFDQAHFINDFRGFSGFTPQEYVRLKNDNINYIPVG